MDLCDVRYLRSVGSHSEFHANTGWSVISGSSITTTISKIKDQISPDQGWNNNDQYDKIFLNIQ